MPQEELRSALAKIRHGADEQQYALLTWMECRVLLAEVEVLRSTAAITTSPEFHDGVERYRKTGDTGSAEQIAEIMRQAKASPGTVVGLPE